MAKRPKRPKVQGFIGIGLGSRDKFELELKMEIDLFNEQRASRALGEKLILNSPLMSGKVIPIPPIPYYQ
jgi:hypothetical protein